MRIKTIEEIKSMKNVTFYPGSEQCDFAAHDGIPGEYMNDDMLRLTGRECRIRNYVPEVRGEFYLDILENDNWNACGWWWTEDMIVDNDEIEEQVCYVNFDELI